MTTLPISMPYVFANVTTTQRLAYLDADFATLTNAINGIGNGSVALANVNITGGNVAASANSVPLSSLQAVGSLNAQHYLRGDGTWSGISSPAGGTVTSVDVSGGTTGFTFSGGPIDVSGVITMSGTYSGNIATSQLTGTIPTSQLSGAVSAANGGTGITSPGTAGNVLTSTGSGWVSQASSAGSGINISQYFASSGTWTCPAGVTKVLAFVIAGGGASPFWCCGVNARDGGAGGYALGFYTVSPGTSYTVTVGSGGSGSSAGTTSSFSSFLTASGGTAAYFVYGPNIAYSGTSGSGSGGTLLNSASTYALSSYSLSGFFSQSVYLNGGGGAKAFNSGAGQNGFVYLTWVQ
jgi:hypothetical protein